jgi:hypothetical protein
MRERSGSRGLRCAIYTRKSSEEGLEQDFNSLHAQREACEAYIASQKQEGWKPVPDTYDDGGFSGASMERPALQRLLLDVTVGKIDVVVVYKVDRLTRSLSDYHPICKTSVRALRSARGRKWREKKARWPKPTPSLGTGKRQWRR